MSTLSFKELIQEALEINQLSINKLATIIKVDRPWLQHALVGRRPLGYDKFESIMSVLNITEPLNTDIREAYAKEYFGEAEFSITKHILAKLNIMANYESATITPLFKANISVFSDFINGFNLNEKQISCVKAMYDILNKELENETPVIYTTYSFDIDCVRLMLLNMVRYYEKPIDYKHISFREYNCSETSIIDTFLYQYEFAGYGYNTYSANTRKVVISASPLQYFIATSTAILYFSHDLQLFYLDEQTDAVTYVHNHFMQNFTEAIPFSYFMHSKEDFSLFTSLRPPVEDNDILHAYDLSPNLCFASYLDADLLMDSVSDSFDHKDFFVHAVGMFFSRYTNIPHSATWSIDSLMHFAECDEEICDYHHVTFDMLSISPENKYKLLCQLQNFAKSGQIRHFVMNNKQNIPSYFHLNIASDGLILGFNFKVYDNDLNHKFIATALSQDPVIFKHLRNLAEYYNHSPYVYDNLDAYAIDQIDNAVLYYKKKHNFD